MSSGHDHASHDKAESAKQPDREAASPEGSERPPAADGDPEPDDETKRDTEDETDAGRHDGMDAREDSPEGGDGEVERQTESAEQGKPDDPEEFDSKSFLTSISDLQAKLQADSYNNIDEDFPADELKDMVETVASTMNQFKQYAMHTQQELEKVREQMKDIKGRLYKRLQAKGYDPKSAQEKKSYEERELEAKIAQLNKEVAKAAEELVRASQATIDSEVAATEASLVAEQAAAEANRIQEEYEARKRAETEARRAEEERREAEKRRIEEEERRQEELRKAEEAKKAKLKKPEENRPPEWENWPTFTYQTNGGSEFTQGLGCMVRADPDSFKENMAAVEVVDPLLKKNILDDYEELVSDIISVQPAHGDENLQRSIYVAIPHCTSRSSAMSREPVIKAEVEDGKWEELRTQEVGFESKKDVKFVQAEVTSFTNLCVVTRFKRDFLHLSKRGGKVSANVDARVTFSVNRGVFKKPEHMVLQLQHVDSATISRIKERSANASKLLTCSAIVNMEWTSESFTEPIYMTLPCPPNPVKAKKAAAARAAKEAKMKNPQPATANITDDRAKKRDKKKMKTSAHQRQQTADDDDDERVNTTHVTKWYMGQYGNNEDDEEDLLYFLKKSASSKWTVDENMSVTQAKLDLLQLQLDEPLQKFMVLRTRTSADIQDAQNLAETLETCLKERAVSTLLRQKIENQCEVVVAVSPINRLEKTMNQFDDEGYESGTAGNSNESKETAVQILNEGDVIEVSFTGNIKCQDPGARLEFVFHSQLNTYIKFPIIEVDKYLQKAYTEYRGFVLLQKKWEVVHVPTKKEESEGDVETWVEVKRALISKHLVKVPKDEEQSPRPLSKAPVRIRSDDYSLDDDTLKRVAQSLGDEWLRVAHYLNVKKQRIQAILRNNVHGDEEDVKYDMLVTWIKKVPRSVNKTEILINALVYANRPDLVNELREQEREYQRRRKGASGSRRSLRSANDTNSLRRGSSHSVRNY